MAEHDARGPEPRAAQRARRAVERGTRQGGINLDPNKGVTPEQLAERWKQVNDLSKARAFNNAMEAAGQAMKAVIGG